MKSYVKSVDSLPAVLKILLAFFLGFIVYGIYRIAKGRVLVGILWLITGGFFGIGWLIDFIQVILHGKPQILV